MVFVDCTKKGFDGMMSIMRLFPSLLLVFMWLSLQGQYLDYLNDLRISSGLIPLKYNSILSVAAGKHCEYMQANKVLDHDEKMLKQKFYGVRPVERALRAGYCTRMVEENIAYNPSGFHGAIDGLMSVVYHRMSLMSIYHDEAGVGQEGNYYDLLLGNSIICSLCEQYRGFYDYMGAYYKQVCADEEIKLPRQKYDEAINSVLSKNKAVIVYPYDGQENVGLYSAEENPNPVPDCNILGYPITVQFNPYYHGNVRVVEFALFDSRDRRVPVIFLSSRNDPHHNLKSYQYALLPRDILNVNIKYKVLLKYRDSSGIKNYTWMFTTKKIDKVVDLEGKKKIYLPPGESDFYVLVRPRSCHDKDFNQVKVSYSVDSFSFEYESLILLHIKLKGRSGRNAKLEFGNGYELSIFIK